MRRFIQLLETRRVPTKTQTKDKTPYDFTSTLYECEEDDSAIAILSECYKVQFSVDTTV